MEKENIMENLKINEAENALFLKWIQEEVLNDTVAPTINEDHLIEMLLKGREENEGIVGLAVGCQQFAEVSGDEGEAVNMVMPLNNRSGSRADRFAIGIASLQKALDSWGVHFHLVMTMSDMEGNAFIHNHQSKGLFEKEKVQSVMQQSSQEMAKLIKQHGGSVDMFSHIKVLMEGMDARNFAEVVKRMTFSQGSFPNEIDIHEMLWELYETDPIFLVNWVQQNFTDNIVWLDLMSPLAGEHRVKLQGEIQHNYSDMPILALLSNSGKWETPPDAHREFTSRVAFVSDILGMKASPQDRPNWLRELMSKSDDLLIGFLSSLGISIAISGINEKNLAIKTIELLAFGDNQMAIAGLEVQEVIINDGETLKALLARVTNQKSSHIFNLACQGQIRVNGEIISPAQLSGGVLDVISVQIGKKVNLVVQRNGH